MTIDPNVPLIWTTKGNVPIADLQCFVEWQKTDDYIKFIEIYKTPEGEIVKESAHVHMLKTPPMGAEQAAFG